MKILITGSSGMIGSALCRYLEKRNYSVIKLKRDNCEKFPYWEPENNIIDLKGEDSIDVVIHLAGENIADGRWTKNKKKRILGSRRKGTELISDYIASGKIKPDIFIVASAVGYYGNCKDEMLTEISPNGDGFLADCCKQWESSTTSASDAEVRVVNARFGIVISKAGGVLSKMTPIFKIGLGGVIGNGKQYISWIAINDLLKAIEFVIKNDNIRGPVNFTSPNPVTNYEFTKELSRAVHRLSILPLPGFAAKIFLGKMAEELLLSSIRAIPEKLLKAGFKFQYRTIKDVFTKYFS